MPLEKLGKYERLDVLGHGASGIVYLAKDTLLGKQVALKEICAQGDEKERFLEEARVLDRLRHPNIVQVNSVDEIGGRVVIDMEYVRGRNLQEVLRETPQLPTFQAISIAAQICDGLDYAHSQRTVHRDIKPANILLTQSGAVKLVDFGLAAQLGTHSFAGGAGTYAYMAPEDFHPEEQSDRQSDIWAVGVILYEMLGGRRPFQVAKAKDPFAWKTAIEHDPLPPLFDLNPDVSPTLEAITAHALARDKALRYRDAGDMAADLRKIFPAAAGTGSVLGIELPGASALPSFPLDLADIDAFLALAPDNWDAAREALRDGTLSRWLRGLEEEPLASVADEAAAEPEGSDDDKLRDFLYRAGLETAEEARRAYAEAGDLTKESRFDEAAALLRRAAHLDPTRPEYRRDLAAALSGAAAAPGFAARAPEGSRDSAVSVRLLPARLSWSRIAVWYAPLLACAGLPVAAALTARLVHPPVHGIQEPGFAAGGLLLLSAFGLTCAAGIAWLPRGLPLGLSGLVFWRLSLMLSRSPAGGKSHLLFAQTVTPILVLLILQICALILDAPGWGNWKIWRWIVAAVGLLTSYTLLHFG